jgi:hypothetical protein
MVKAKHRPEVAPDWLSLRVLSPRVAGSVCLCLVQMVTAKHLPVLPLALLWRPGAHDRVCLLGWAKLAPQAP